MITATMSNDVQVLSKGRLLLGLGSQIKPHIERRYSMPWSHPAARMREYIQALHAIWDCWQEGTKLDFKGDFYTFNLMTPFFNPGPNPYGKPKVFLAAVGELMTEVAGEVADGILVHGFTTEQYLREVTLPAIDRGLAKAGRDRSAFQLSYPGFVVTGDTDEQMEQATKAVKAQIAFYGSTPAYKGVLELHGWGDLHLELHPLSKQGEWVKMGDAHQRRRAEHVRGRRPARGSGSEGEGEVWRRDRSFLLLCAVQARRGSLGRGDGGVPRLTLGWRSGAALTARPALHPVIGAGKRHETLPRVQSPSRHRREDEAKAL